MQVTLGGERLGSGNKQKVHLRNYERSTHDLGYVWRSTMASGTLVPFMSEVGLPGDTFDIKLDVDVLTHPTIGPLFGSYKVQLDTFVTPIRLYQGKLHMNMLNIGMNMANIKLPLIKLQANNVRQTDFGVQDIDNWQVNSSCIMSYLNVRGLGHDSGNNRYVTRNFNAISLLAYWDIYKNYYANKQETIGYVIHNPMQPIDIEVEGCRLLSSGLENELQPYTNQTNPGFTILLNADSKLILDLQALPSEGSWEADRLIVWKDGQLVTADTIFQEWEFDYINNNIIYSAPYLNDLTLWIGGYYQVDTAIHDYGDYAPKMQAFDLENIDEMRKAILVAVQQEGAYMVNDLDLAPYSLLTETYINPVSQYMYTSLRSNQEGLGLKTYQSDLFNNWISTEWIDGENGINEITRVSTTDGSFTIDELNLSRKIYDMLNRIALSGGTFDDWLDATYTHERVRSSENPMYMGGLIRELVFQEVISNAAAGEENSQPLGTLAGRGVLAGKPKGGDIYIKIDEPSYIMGIASLTPRIDYSQGNKWDVNLRTMDDFHKPALDEIGFQDLITEQMAWWTTRLNNDGETFQKSAGKQPAWINYMTNVNQVRGNFADQGQQMFMTLTRRYERAIVNEGLDIKDLTTYIDPSKFNHIFADTRRDAQNFWVQIGVDITARRKMSAKVIPNL